jgi:hypothetical protein
VRRIVQQNFGAALLQPGEEPAHFVHQLSNFRYAPNRDENARPTEQEVDLSSEWIIVGHSELLRAAAERFCRYMNAAMSAHLAVGTRGLRL